MIHFRKLFAKQLSECIKMYMFVVCGVSENMYKQTAVDENSVEDSVYYRLTSMIDKGQFNEAENAMYDWLNKNNISDYYTMLCIYDYMNEYDDEFLEINNYSREEIQDGIENISRGKGNLDILSFISND